MSILRLLRFADLLLLNLFLYRVDEGFLLHRRRRPVRDSLNLAVSRNGIVHRLLRLVQRLRYFGLILDGLLLLRHALLLDDVQHTVAVREIERSIALGRRLLVLDSLLPNYLLVMLVVQVLFMIGSNLTLLRLLLSELHAHNV